MSNDAPATKRAAQVAAIHEFAEWLAANPDMPVPTLSFHRHLHDSDGTETENLDTVRNLAVGLAVGTDEHLDDRTVLRVKVNEHVWYEVFAWHKGGRGNIGELARLRARIAELEGTTDPDATGLTYTRADSEADDPTPVSPARVPLHTGSVVDGDVLVTDDPEPFVRDPGTDAVLSQITGKAAQ